MSRHNGSVPDENNTPALGTGSSGADRPARVGRRYTPTQERMLKVLNDGCGHRADELRACVDDELAEGNIVAFHVSALRGRLPPGYDVVCRGGLYRLVRFARLEE